MEWRLSVPVLVSDTADGVGENETYWIEGPGDPDTVDVTGTPWAAALAPLAASGGHELRLEVPVDARVLDGVRRVSEIWSAWYDGVAPISVRADAVAGPEGGGGAGRVAAFFSGGVDSLWTALELRDGAAAQRTLLTVHGFDVPLEEAEAFDRMRERFDAWTTGWGGGGAALATNFRRTASGKVPWGPLAHGCALVAVGLAVGPRFDVLRIASTGGVRDPHPWGSHLETDHLLGSLAVRVEHHGAEAARWQKVRRIVEDEGALSLLRVCWRSGTDANCGVCSKCLRTTALLELHGALDRAPTFPARLDLDALARVFVRESWDVREFTDLVSLATRSGRPDVAGAASAALRRSRRGRRTLGALRRLERTPGLGGPVRSLRARIEAGWIA